MGRKQTRTGKYIYFCIASLIFLSLSGCVALEKIMKPPSETSRQRLSRKTQELLHKGDYESALKENQKVLFSHGSTEDKDLALFNIGVIYAHVGNPKKDFGKSVSSFKKLMDDFPQSPLYEQAKILTAILQENEKLNRAVEKLNEENKKLEQMIEKSKQVDIEIEEKKREKGK
jgi:outer membrane protein assembly factor BamD (BamD/ComL family)